MLTFPIEKKQLLSTDERSLSGIQVLKAGYREPSIFGEPLASVSPLRHRSYGRPYVKNITNMNGDA